MERSVKINNFDLLRIIAASQVMLGHAMWHLEIPEPRWWFLWQSFPGVSIFFVISGFLISSSYERSPNLRTYARNRLLRIFPALWCCIFVTILIAAFFGTSFANWQAPIWVISQLVGITYTPEFLEGFGFGSYNGSLWTIPVELQFYIALPVLYWVIRDLKNPNLQVGLAFLSFFALTLCIRTLFPKIDDIESQSIFGKLVGYSFFPHFYLFLTGVLLQRLQTYNWRLIKGKGLYWLAAYLLFRVLVHGSPLSSIGSMLFLAITTVSIAYTLPHLSEKLLRGNDISYGVYIYHGLFLNVLVELDMVGEVEYVILLFAITFVVGYLSWIGIEKPCLRRKAAAHEPDVVLLQTLKRWLYAIATHR